MQNKSEQTPGNQSAEQMGSVEASVGDGMPSSISSPDQINRIRELESNDPESRPYTTETPLEEVDEMMQIGDLEDKEREAEARQINLLSRIDTPEDLSPEFQRWLRDMQANDMFLRREEWLNQGGQSAGGEARKMETFTNPDFAGEEPLDFELSGGYEHYWEKLDTAKQTQILKAVNTLPPGHVGEQLQQILARHSFNNPDFNPEEHPFIAHNAATHQAFIWNPRDKTWTVTPAMDGVNGVGAVRDSNRTSLGSKRLRQGYSGGKYTYRIMVSGLEGNQKYADQVGNDYINAQEELDENGLFSFYNRSDSSRLIRIHEKEIGIATEGCTGLPEDMAGSLYHLVGEAGYGGEETFWAPRLDTKEAHD